MTEMSQNQETESDLLPNDSQTERAEDSALASALSRSEYLYRQLRRRGVVNAALLLLLLLSIAGNVSIFWALWPPQYKYFTVGADGLMVPAVPVERPYQTSEQVLGWLDRITRKIWSLHFATWEDQLQDVKDDFYRPVYEQMVQEVRKNYGPELKGSRLVMQVATSPGKVVRQGTIKGRYFVEVEIPAEVSVYTGRSKRITKMTVGYRVVRVDLSKRPRTGMVITQYWTEDRH